MSHSSILARGAAALLTAAASVQAGPFFQLDFDGPGAIADDFAPIFLTIGYGIFEPTLDGFGDPIPGSEHWKLDFTAPPVPVGDPDAAGFGPAPSGTKALDARDGTVLFVFDTPASFDRFTTTLDNSTLGGLFGTAIEFYGAAHNLLFSLPVNQSIPGAFVEVGPLTGVKTIALPGNAFYDNVAAVPEPGTCASLLGGVGVLLTWRRRRR
jgi:hypothetical protein